MRELIVSKCERASRRFQEEKVLVGKGPSRGLLHDCEINGSSASLHRDEAEVQLQSSIPHHPEHNPSLPHRRYRGPVQQEIKQRKDSMMHPDSHYMDKLRKL